LAFKPTARRRARDDPPHIQLWLALVSRLNRPSPHRDQSFAIDISIRILLFSLSASPGTDGRLCQSNCARHAAYFGLGAYTTILQIDFGISPWIGRWWPRRGAMLASLPIGWRASVCGSLFHHRDHRDGASADAIFLKFAISLGRRRHHEPISQRAVEMQFEARRHYYVASGSVLGLTITG